MSLRRLPSLISLALLAAACSSTKSSTRVGHDGPWVQPSPEFQRQIDLHAAKLPYLQRLEDFVAEIQWMVGAGEPAYEVLLELAASDDAKVAGCALAALGGSADARLVPHLAKIPWPGEDDASSLRYERARCHMKLGDWSHIGVLIDGLEDENLYARSLCFKALRDSTGETFEYHPKAEIAERNTALASWRAWSSQVAGDKLQR